MRRKMLLLIFFFIFCFLNFIYLVLDFGICVLSLAFKSCDLDFWLCFFFSCDFVAEAL